MVNLAQVALSKVFPARPYHESLAEMPEIRMSANNQAVYEWHDGEKFPGGYGPTPILTIDYWTLRARSEELFERNIYARGLIRRLVTAIIGPGLTIEATPNPEIIGLTDEACDHWTEQAELFFSLWAGCSEICDAARENTFWEQQKDIFREALVVGDVLTVTTQDKRTGLPKIRKISGGRVQTPLGYTPPAGLMIKHGVELDSSGEHVAYHVCSVDQANPFTQVFERIMARDKSGRRIARLVYGSDTRLDGVRGQPILALALQSLKEIDRYKDSTLRKAMISSILAFIVTKGEGKMSSGVMRQMGGGFQKGIKSDIPDQNGKLPLTNVASMVPGMLIDSLQAGEDIKSFGSGGTDEKFAEFEGAIVSAIAWHLEIPPEIAGQKFSSNYSASMAANSEFSQVIDVRRESFGEQCVKPAYREVLLSGVITSQLRAPGMLTAWNNPSQWILYESWNSCEMSGAVKASVDPLKMSRAMQNDVEQGFITRTRASRLMHGTSFRQNVRINAKENALLAEAMAPLLAMTKPEPTAPPKEKEREEPEDPEEKNGPPDDGESAA